MTCGDSNYFEFLKNFEKNVFERFGFYPVVYDLGLSELQRNDLRSEVRKVPVPDTFLLRNSRGNIQAVHKPYCVMDFLDAYEEDCLCVDADTVFTAAVSRGEFGEADVAVTPRHPKEQQEKYYKNGLINSGFVFFRNNSGIRELLNLWAEKCRAEEYTDQMALSDVLADEVALLDGPAEQNWKGLRARLMDPEVYNDVVCRTGKLFHFKNAGRKEKARAKYRRFVKLQAFAPAIVEALVSFNRKTRLLVWRGKKG